MNIASYCKGIGFSLIQYETFEANIKETASAILQNIKTLHKPDTGIYYSINELFNIESDATIKGFIIQELKKLGVEFYDNNTLYRY